MRALLLLPVSTVVAVLATLSCNNEATPPAGSCEQAYLEYQQAQTALDNCRASDPNCAANIHCCAEELALAEQKHATLQNLVEAGCIGSGSGTGGSNANDADGDGIPNDRDICPGTPQGEATDDRGCPVFSNCLSHPDLFDCAPEICDPLSDWSDDRGCSPAVAYIIMDEGVNNWWERPFINRFYKQNLAELKQRGYQVKEIRNGTDDDVIEALLHTSTKALVVFSHGQRKPKNQPLGTPSVSGMPETTIATLVQKRMREELTSKGIQNAEQIAAQHAASPNLDLMYNYSCYSLDTKTLANYLVKKGGRYKGCVGVWRGVMDIQDYKP